VAAKCSPELYKLSFALVTGIWSFVVFVTCILPLFLIYCAGNCQRYFIDGDGGQMKEGGGSRRDLSQSS
jgi:hypothetical protein